MLTVVTPATSTALTTVSRARTMLAFSMDDDVLSDRLIDQASALVVDYCRRPFALETVQERFDIRNARCGGALLSRSPVTVITTVSADGTVIVSPEYTFDRDLGCLYRSDAAGHLYGWWGETLTVTYSAGYTLPNDDDGSWTLPYPVERAVTLILGTYLSAGERDPLVKSESVEGIGSTSWWVPSATGGLPSPEAENLLQPYRRMF